MSTVLITGGTGLIGRALRQALTKKGYEVIILSRNVDRSSPAPGISYATWDIQQQVIDATAISRADYIIHLAGAGVAEKRWTKQRKQEILDSRVNSSRLIVNSLTKIPNKVKAVISASAIGWYGTDAGSTGLSPFTEGAPPANDFLGTTCMQWEESIRPVSDLNIRLVVLRTGIVLSAGGGALKEFMRPLKWGIATILGNGKQVISWIHIDDMVNMYLTAIENENMNGVYNAVAPAPVSNKELVLQLARCRKKIFIPVRVPSFLLKMVLGEMSIEVLKSTTVSCEKILTTGFIFHYPDIGSAVFSLTR